MRDFHSFLLKWNGYLHFWGLMRNFCVYKYLIYRRSPTPFGLSLALRLTLLYFNYFSYLINYFRFISLETKPCGWRNCLKEQFFLFFLTLAMFSNSCHTENTVLQTRTFSTMENRVLDSRFIHWHLAPRSYWWWGSHKSFWLAIIYNDNIFDQ